MIGSLAKLNDTASVEAPAAHSGNGAAATATNGAAASSQSVTVVVSPGVQVRLPLAGEGLLSDGVNIIRQPDGLWQACHVASSGCEFISNCELGFLWGAHWAQALMSCLAVWWLAVSMALMLLATDEDTKGMESSAFSEDYWATCRAVEQATCRAACPCKVCAPSTYKARGIVSWLSPDAEA